jgi:hypothetical protein
MEPVNPKSTPPDDADLEAWLRANGNLVPLPDAGFSTRVLTALPRASARRIQRSIGCLAAMVVGGALALAGVLGSGRDAADDLFVSVNHPLATPPALIALVATAGSLCFVYRARLRPRLWLKM